MNKSLSLLEVQSLERQWCSLVPGTSGGEDGTLRSHSGQTAGSGQSPQHDPATGTEPSPGLGAVDTADTL